MTRIHTPATIELAPAAAQPMLQAVKKQLGVAPNLFRLVANSPAALEGYLGLSGALAKGELPAANRRGTSNDAKADAAVRFAAKVTKLRGHVANEDFAAVKAAGYSDAQVIEIVQHVALNTWTNYINTVGQTEIDFPVVKADKAA